MRILDVLRRLLTGRDDDPAWHSSGYCYTAEGFDPQLRERTAAKRLREDRIRQVAARIATRPAEERTPLRVIGGGR